MLVMVTAAVSGGGQRDAAAAKSLQSCPTLCDPIDSSLPGSPIPGVRGMTPEQTLEGEVGLARQKKQ